MDDPNLNYAFGITAYDRNREPIEDPSYGVLTPYYKSWGLKGMDVDFEELPTRDCSLRELHIEENNINSDKDEIADLEKDEGEGGNFFLPSANSIKDLTFYSKKLKCLDKKSLQIQGDYNSPRTR